MLLFDASMSMTIPQISRGRTGFWSNIDCVEAILPTIGKYQEVEQPKDASEKAVNLDVINDSDQ